LGEKSKVKKASFLYDIFLSYSSKDKYVIRKLAERLRSDGLRVWLDEWEIGPGDLIGLKVEHGLEQSQILLLAMSKNSFASEWVTLERHTALFRDPTNEDRRFIPIRLDDSEIKPILRQFAYIDWRSEASQQYEKLLAACNSALLKYKPTGNDLASQILRGHALMVNTVTGITAKKALSGSHDGELKIWDLKRLRVLKTLKSGVAPVHGSAASTDGKLLASCSEDSLIRLWDLSSGSLIQVLPGHTNSVLGISLNAEGSQAVSCSKDSTVRVWDLKNNRLLYTLEGHAKEVWGVAQTPDGAKAISCSSDKTLKLWDLKNGELLSSLEGHTQDIWGVAISSDGKKAVSCSKDTTIRVWNLDEARLVATLEGHTRGVWCVTITNDGQYIVSGSEDSRVAVWELNTGHLIGTFSGHSGAVLSVAVSGNKIVSGGIDATLRVWDIEELLLNSRDYEATRYTNAKVLLVGDSGVGKSGLAYRLTQNRFEATISTDAVWATQWKLSEIEEERGLEREVWLWDFAGQADYRLIHQLYMDETALAVLVFNPQSDNPFDGLSQWDRDLVRAARRRFQKILVAGRCDRGGLTVSRKSIEQFREERNFSIYLETSARTGVGCDSLREAIINNIRWEEIPWTSSPKIFKLLKEQILTLRDEGRALLRIAELKQQLEIRLPEVQFSLEELRAVVGLLAGPGIVWHLEFGGFILLQPERVNSYAAAVIRRVRAHSDEIGCILEEEVLAGNLDYQDMQRLVFEDEQIVLRAMHQTFVDHGLCLRERTEQGTILVFPSYFKRERPELEDHPALLATYQFSGPVEEIYATLIVRLHHAAAFEKDQLWRLAADFRTHEGRRVGIRMSKRAEGVADIEVFADPEVPSDTKITFLRYVDNHVRARAEVVERIRCYSCDKCGEDIPGDMAVRTKQKGRNSLYCMACGSNVALYDTIEEKFSSDEIGETAKRWEVKATSRVSEENLELVLTYHSIAISQEAGQVFIVEPTDYRGVDSSIEFISGLGVLSGSRIFLQIRPRLHYDIFEEEEGGTLFRFKKNAALDFWRAQVASPVMLVFRGGDGVVRWMNVSKYLQDKDNRGKTEFSAIGEPFTSLNLLKMRDKALSAK
jgi:small GTP-binding protein